MRFLARLSTLVLALVASAIATVATYFLAFWMLLLLLSRSFPDRPGQGWPWWTQIAVVGALVCAVAVAVAVVYFLWWRPISNIDRCRAGYRSSQETGSGEYRVDGLDAASGRRVGRGLSARIRVALIWTVLTTLLAFASMFFTPLIIGGSGGSMAPIFALVLTPVIFVITLVLTLIGPRLGILTIVASLAYPVWYSVMRPPRQVEGKLLPLSAEERQITKSRRFGLRVAVDAGRFPPAYQQSLRDDLARTGLFKHVGPIGAVSSPDLIATVTGTYYGDTTGDSFSLQWARQSGRRVNVRVWCYVPGLFASASGRRLLGERLTVEVIRQMDALGPPSSVVLQDTPADASARACVEFVTSPSGLADLVVTESEWTWDKYQKKVWLDETITNQSDTHTYEDLWYAVVVADSGTVVRRGHGLICQKIYPGQTRQFRRLDAGVGFPSQVRKGEFAFGIVGATQIP